MTRTPRTWLGTIAEAVMGTAGRSIIVGGAWYRFSRSRGLVASNAELAIKPGLHIAEAGESIEAERRALDAMVGTPWSLRTNCLTVFSPFWRPDMSSISPGDRDSISRRVVLSLVAFLVVLAAVLAGAHWYVQEMIVAPLQAQQAAHYRSIVTHLGQVKARLPD